MPNSTASQLDYYRILGVSYKATPAEIKRAYRAAMKRSHPDRLAPDQRAGAESHARALNEAFRVLSKPESKQRYDAQLKASMLQEQIMSRYSGGLGAPGADQNIYARIRAAQQAEQRKKRKQSDWDATTSLLVIFVGFTLIVLALLVLGSVLASILRSVG
jgi:DnaJ-class molecular chaperone